VPDLGAARLELVKPEEPVPLGSVPGCGERGPALGRVPIGDEDLHA
jgi:hypothetical protein